MAVTTKPPVRLERCLDADRINRIMNHPAVRDGCGLRGAGDLDVSAALYVPGTYFLMGKHGGFGLERMAPGVHEVHVFMLPSGRGRWALAAAAVMVDYTKRHGDWKLQASIPADRPDVDLYARMVGFHPTGLTVETFGVGYTIFEMELA